METTETTQSSLDDFGLSGDFVIVTNPGAAPEATINERWYRLYSHSKAMCELMVAFNTELEPGYAPQGLGVAVHDQLSKLENLVTAARILITPAIAATGQWKREGAPNPERWFAGKTGKSPAKARAEMETGKNLGEAPGTRKAFLEGELSAEQADTIADAVEANPEAEQALLDAAKEASLKELKDEAARRKAEVEDMEKRERRIHKGRYVRTWTDSGGAWNLHAKGTIPDGADFASVLERLIDQQFKQARKNGVRGTRDNYAFDALMNMAAQHGQSGFGAGDPGPANPGDPGPSNPGPSNLGNAGCVDASPDGNDDSRNRDDGNGGDSAGPSGGSRPKPTRLGGSGPTGATGPKPTDQGSAGPSPSPEPSPTPNGSAGPSARPGPNPNSPGSRRRRPGTADGSADDGTGSTRSSTNTSTQTGLPFEDLGAALVDPDGAEESDGSEGTTAHALAGPTQRPRPPISKNQIFCIDWSALVRGRVFAGERCELRGSGPVSVTAVRRALATSAAKLVVTDETGRVVTVAHLGTGAINLRLIPGPVDTTRHSSNQPGADSGSSQPTIVIIAIRLADLVVAGAAQADESRRAVHISGVGGGADDRSLPSDTAFEAQAPSDPLKPTVDIPGVGSVSTVQARSLLGAESLARLVSRGQALRSITHTGRAPNAAQHIALAWADTTCKVHGCPNQRVELDHRRPWSEERVTEFENLDPLCAHHHALKTNHGWRFASDGPSSFGPQDAAAPAGLDRPSHHLHSQGA